MTKKTNRKGDKLINLLISNNLYLSGSGITDEFGGYVDYKLQKSDHYVFNLIEQAKMVSKLCLVINRVKISKKPIMFFGVNRSGLSKHDNLRALSINEDIFNLCFSSGTFPPSANKDFFKAVILFEKVLSDLFTFFYRDKVVLKDNFIRRMYVADAAIEAFIRAGVVRRNGYFFDAWEPGSSTNFRALEASVVLSIWDFFNNKGTHKTFSRTEFSNIRDRYRNLFFIGEVFARNSESPGAAVFFSRRGYEGAFSELRELNIPIICVVSSGDSFEGVDYPLLGNHSRLTTTIFYRKFLEVLFLWEPKSNKIGSLEENLREARGAELGSRLFREVSKVPRSPLTQPKHAARPSYNKPAYKPPYLGPAVVTTKWKTATKKVHYETPSVDIHRKESDNKKPPSKGPAIKKPPYVPPYVGPAVVEPNRKGSDNKKLPSKGPATKKPPYVPPYLGPAVVEPNRKGSDNKKLPSKGPATKKPPYVPPYLGPAVVEPNRKGSDNKKLPSKGSATKKVPYVPPYVGPAVTSTKKVPVPPYAPPYLGPAVISTKKVPVPPYAPPYAPPYVGPAVTSTKKKVPVPPYVGPAVTSTK